MTNSKDYLRQVGISGLFRISWGCYANTLYPLRSRNNLLKNDSGFDKP